MPEMPSRTPNLGEWINFVLPIEAAKVGEIRPAIVINRSYPFDGSVTLYSYHDKDLDMPGHDCPEYRPGTAYASDGLPGTWHFPSGDGLSFRGSHANFRNLVNDQTAVQSRVPLKIDGLKTENAFNNLGVNIWNPATSRITPTSLEQKFSCRINLSIAPTVAGSLLDLTIDISPPNAPGTLTPVFADTLQLFRMQETPITRFTAFYVSPIFLANGGQICVACTDPCAITSASLYLKLTGGQP